MIRKFEVTDGIKLGECWAYYDHFVIYWYDGTETTTLDLSNIGVRKTFAEQM